MHIGDVVEDVYSRCLRDPDEMKQAIREMVHQRWTAHDLSMHVACRLPPGSSFHSFEERRHAVISDLIESCLASDSMLRVVVATDVATWTDEEIQAYGKTDAVPAPCPM
jgi:hypothetical protein